VKTNVLPRNPFATRHTRPGVLPPLDAEGQPLDIRQLLLAIRAHGGASIEGPHGTGKSTLLAAITRVARDVGANVETVRLRTGRQAFAAFRAIRAAGPGAIVGVDGWEMLGPFKGVARWVAWWRGVGLVVTAHESAGFPFVIRTSATLPLLTAIVDRLPDHGGLIDARDLNESLARHPGNLREALLDLYDRFEHRARMNRS
jgi:hypothetical protein